MITTSEMFQVLIVGGGIGCSLMMLAFFMLMSVMGGSRVVYVTPQPTTAPARNFTRLRDLTEHLPPQVARHKVLEAVSEDGRSALQRISAHVVLASEGRMGRDQRLHMDGIQRAVVELQALFEKVGA